MRMKGIIKYQIEYSKGEIPRDIENKVIEIFRNANSGYLNFDEMFGEILDTELLSIIKKTEDTSLKEALQFLYNESSKDENWDNYVRFAII